jgi:hypothetical protein
LLGDQVVMAYDFLGPLVDAVSVASGVDDQLPDPLVSGGVAGADDQDGDVPYVGVEDAVLLMPAKYDALLPLAALGGTGLLGDQDVILYDFLGPLVDVVSVASGVKGMDDQLADPLDSRGATAGDDDQDGDVSYIAVEDAVLLDMPAKYDALLPLAALGGTVLLGDQVVILYDFFGPLSSITEGSDGAQDEAKVLVTGAVGGGGGGGEMLYAGVAAAVTVVDMLAKYEALLPLASGLDGTALLGDQVVMA